MFLVPSIRLGCDQRYEHYGTVVSCLWYAHLHTVDWAFFSEDGVWLPFWRDNDHEIIIRL